HSVGAQVRAARAATTGRTMDHRHVRGRRRVRATAEADLQDCPRPDLMTTGLAGATKKPRRADALAVWALCDLSPRLGTRSRPVAPPTCSELTPAPSSSGADPIRTMSSAPPVLIQRRDEENISTKH